MEDLSAFSAKPRLRPAARSLFANQGHAANNLYHNYAGQITQLHNGLRWRRRRSRPVSSAAGVIPK
jgi:hypothetical protein